MGLRHAAVVAGLALGVMSGAAQAAYIVTIEQQGANVVATGTGSLNTAGLDQSSGGNYRPHIDPNGSEILLGDYNGADYYSGILNPMSFGTGGQRDTETVSGPFIYLFASLDRIGVPSGYVSGTDIGISTATFANTTLQSLGLETGTFVYNLGPSNGIVADTFTISILSPVPLPASAPMFGAALLGLAGLGYAAKRKKAAIPA